MAFTARSPRWAGTDRNTGTSDRVGPGSYDARRPGQSDHHRVNLVPFGSGAVRETLPLAEATPVSYITPYSNIDRSPCSWNVFKSSAPRFSSQIDDETAVRPLGINHTPWASPDKRSLVKRVTVSTPRIAIPSIPRKTFGYVMGPDGAQVKRVPPPMEIVEQTPDHPVIKAPDFGRAAERFPETGATEPTPGPGHYDVIDSERQAYDGGKINRLSAAFSFMAMKGGQPPLVNKMGQSPGPGSYTIPDGFTRFRRTYPLQFQDFGSRIGRNRVGVVDDNPGPGSYDIDHKPIYIRLRPPPVPFNTRAERQVNHHTEPGPGPQEYNLPSSIIVPRRRAPVPFCSSTTRFTQVKRETTPPPRLDRQRSRRRGIPPRKATFNRATVSNRIPESGPAPGSYEIDKCTTAFRIKRFKGKGYQFASRSIRTPAQVIQSVRKEVDGADHPSPSRSPATARPPGNGSAVFMSRTDRFDSDANTYRMPGPGQYEVRSSMIRPTFNVTIDPNFDPILSR